MQLAVLEVALTAAVLKIHQVDLRQCTVMVERWDPTGLVDYERQGQSVWVVTTDYFEFIGLTEEQSIPKRAKVSQTLLYPIKFVNRPHIAGKRPNA